MSERIEDVVAVNAGKKGKKAKHKKGGGKKAGGKSKSGGKRRAKHAPKARRGARRSRKSNPSIDFKGTAAAAAGGILGELLATPAAHFAGGMVKKEGIGKGAVRAVAGGGAALLGSLALGMVAPAMAKGMAGAAGAQFPRQILGAAAVTAKDPGILSKVGFAVLPLPQGVYVKDGALYRKDAAGDKLLLGFQIKPITIEMDDGSRKPASLLGALGNDALIMDSEGEIRLLAGAIVDAYPNPQGGRVGDVVPAYANPQAGARRLAGPGEGPPSATGYSEDQYS